MGRAPCCEKMGLKKGPWTPEEDQVLINYIKLHGHGNWRALPKQAGLLRCGKSCRLRWTNYLRPDIKRGNFTKEEEDTIINLHEMLGNRWSAIAARLPGRTDNEIKNVWHTHLKKRLIKQIHGSSNDNKRRDTKKQQLQQPGPELPLPPPAVNVPTNVYRPVSPPTSSSEVSTITTSENNSTSSSSTIDNINMKMESGHEEIYEIDENFWSEVLSTDNSNVPSDLPLQEYLASSPLDYGSNLHEYGSDTNMDFWYNLFSRVGDLPQLPEI